MLKFKRAFPLDYSLCQMTVTVYDAYGTARVLNGVHYEFTDSLEVEKGIGSHGRGFLLVIPGADPIAVGDRVLLGQGPEKPAFNTAQTDTLGVAASVRPRYFRGRICHTEVRG